MAAPVVGGGAQGHQNQCGRQRDQGLPMRRCDLWCCDRRDRVKDEQGELKPDERRRATGDGAVCTWGADG